MNLSKQTKIVQAITVAAGASGATDVSGSVIDMQGYDGIMFLAQWALITAGGAQSLKVQQDSAVGMGAAADLAGTGITVADNDDNKTFFIDIWRPRERFVRLVALRATQVSVLSAIAILYGGSKLPTEHQATVIIGETHASPAEGAA